MQKTSTIAVSPDVCGLKNAPRQRLLLLRSSTPPSLSICMSYTKRPAPLFYDRHAELSGCNAFCKSPHPRTQPLYGCVTVCQSPLHSLVAPVKSMPGAANELILLMHQKSYCLPDLGKEFTPRERDQWTLEFLKQFRGMELRPYSLALASCDTMQVSLTIWTSVPSSASMWGFKLMVSFSLSCSD